VTAAGIKQKDGTYEVPFEVTITGTYTVRPEDLTGGGEDEELTDSEDEWADEDYRLEEAFDLAEEKLKSEFDWFWVEGASCGADVRVSRA